MPFKSKAQQRFAYGTGQPWAPEWAAATKKTKKGFAGLPQHVRKAEQRDLRRRWRAAAHPPDPQRHDVDSKAIASMGYQRQSRRMAVRMHSRDQPYTYRMRPGDADAFDRAPSKGRHYVEHVRGKAKRKTKVTPADRARLFADPPEQVAKSEEAPMGTSAFGIVHDFDPDELAKRHGGCKNPHCALPAGHTGPCKESMGKALNPAEMLGHAKGALRGVKAGVGGFKNSGMGEAEKLGHKVGTALMQSPKASAAIGRAAAHPGIEQVSRNIEAVRPAAARIFRAARGAKPAAAPSGSLRRVGNWAAANPGKAALAGAGGVGGVALLNRRNNS